MPLGLAGLLVGSLAGCRVSQPAAMRATTPVGMAAGQQCVVTPVNQVVTPVGRLVELPGLRPQVVALSPDGRLLVTAGKTHELIVVDPDAATLRQRVSLPSEKVDVPQPEAVSTHILEPDKEGQVSFTGLVFSADGSRLYLANVNGSVKVFAVDAQGTVSGLASLPLPAAHAPRRKNEIPAGLAISRDGSRLYVANIKGIGPGKTDPKTGQVSGNSHQYHGSLSLLPVPGRRDLARHTRTVLRNYREPMVQAALLPPRPGQSPRPVPERGGEPSVFRHVIYVIKENRTYDQVLGDVPQGNGEPSLCIFGDRVTPNQHRLVRDFVLLDNTYCSGILSADGHQWSDTAFATDYMERSFAGFPRSYPDGMDDNGIDALAYAPSGFLWDNALAHGRTVRDYGEFAITEKQWADPARKGRIGFLDHYHDFLHGTGLIRISSRPAIESLRPHLNSRTVGWDMDIPDAFRAAEFSRELREFERTGSFPNLVIICLPNDHTSGTKEGAPTPAAQVADNDLAFGRIVEAISQGPFWNETCIFAIEDDPQAGWDHVSGYRTTAYVVSPYTRRGVVVSTQYNTTSILRTIELMLGLPPMNQMDASATPMTDCFSDTPDFTPFTALPNNVPLDEMNPPAKKVADPLLRRHAVASAKLPLGEIDQCPEDLLNRILWHAMKGSGEPYPEWAVSAGADTVDDD